MNYLSVCSGIEAATVAWHDMGWKPIGFSEIEKFPSQLLQHHYPHVTNYGDMTKYKEWNITENIIPSIANCLQTTCNDYSRADGFNIIPMGIYNNISDTVTAKFAKGAELLQQGAKNGGNCIFHPIISEPKSYGIPGNWIGRKPENGGNATTPMNDIAPCLTKTDVHGVSYDMRVRRLTPIECERLQGFPDNYTNTPTSSDTTRYKALGNSMAVPVMKWIGQRINDIS